MNISNQQIPQNLHSCCCCCSSRGRGAKYRDYSAYNGDGADENYQNNYNCQTVTNNNQPFAHEDLYENLMELIDDQMMSTMSCLKKKARKILKSELENFNTEVNNRPCTCPEEIRGRGTNIKERANEIDYQPQSNFLQKMMNNYREQRDDHPEGSGARKKSSKSKQKRRSSPKGKTFQSGDVSPKSGPDSGGLKKSRQPVTAKKAEHDSRPKTKGKARTKRKRMPGEKEDSGAEVSVKSPHEDCCERCWRFASPPRSPVNKPDQRYDPNFRRGHSCEHLGRPEELLDERGNYVNPCKNLPPLETTIRPDRQPLFYQYEPPKKPAQIDIPQTQNYAAQYTPFTGREAYLGPPQFNGYNGRGGTYQGSPQYSPYAGREAYLGPPQYSSFNGRGGTYPGAGQYGAFNGRGGGTYPGAPPKYQYPGPVDYTKVKQLAFDWPTQRPPTMVSPMEQMMQQTRPRTSEKYRLPDQTEVGGRHPNGRIRTRRPKTYAAGFNKEDAWGHYSNLLDPADYEDICGVKIRHTYDPCISRTPGTIGRRGPSYGTTAEMREEGSRGRVMDGGSALDTRRSSKDDKGGFDAAGGRAGKGKGLEDTTESAIRASREDVDGGGIRGKREEDRSKEERLGKEKRAGKDGKGGTEVKKTGSKRIDKKGDKRTAGSRRGTIDGRFPEPGHDRDDLAVEFGEAIVRGGSYKKDRRRKTVDSTSFNFDGLRGVGGEGKHDSTSREKSKSHGIPRPYLKPKRPPSAKTPKSKSPPKTPKDTPRRSKDKKGAGASRRDKSQTGPSQYEVTSYFKLPEKVTRPTYDTTSSGVTSAYDTPGMGRASGLVHPIRECQCYPRVVPDVATDSCLCCHCNYKDYDVSEPRGNYYDRPDTLGVGGRCSPAPPPPSAREPTVTQTPRPCTCPRGPPVSNYNDYSEQLFDRRGMGVTCTDKIIPCPYKRFTTACTDNPALLNQQRYQMNNDNSPLRSFSQSPPMNAEMSFPSHFPRKYCVYYMTKGKENKRNDVEVLVEELCQSCPKDERMVNVCEKMKRVERCQNESMALKFQKGVSECPRPPEKTRVLYF